MNRETEWFRQQSEYNRRVYERLDANHDDLADWKVTVIFYSALHRINYWLAVRTGQSPKNHFERKEMVEQELPQVRKDYKSLYLMSMRARYCEGFRVSDSQRKHAAEVLDRIEKEMPFR